MNLHCIKVTEIFAINTPINGDKDHAYHHKNDSL